MTTRIFKYQIDSSPWTHLSMPKNAVILSVQAQNGTLTMWAAVDPEAEEEQRHFLRVVTGGEVPDDLEYIGTVQFNNGHFVIHIFEGFL